MSTLLEVRAIEKSFRGRRVLSGLDLTWAGPGTLVVFGANGAGKSTLLRILGGVLQADRGEVVIAGASLATERAHALRNVGYMPEAADYPGHLTVKELFVLVATLRGAPPPELEAETEDPFGARELLRHRFGSLSLGQRQRVCLTATLIGDAPLLLLDEPSTGLDTEGARRLEELLGARKAQGKSAVVATHDRGLARAVADRTVEVAGGAIAPVATAG